MPRPSKKTAPPVSYETAQPTRRAYGDLDHAYDHFNAALFDGRLPRCLITMQRKSKAFGFFAGARFGANGATLERVFAGGSVVDEIALNPSHFAERGTEGVLSTLVHEMVHLWQHHFGKPTRAGYHNKEWAAKMRDVGLVPSSTGAPGGKETGQRVSHYVAPTGPFLSAYGELLAQGFVLAYVERGDAEEETKKKKSASKTKFTCPGCSANAWGKPELHLVCGDCEERMLPPAESLAGLGAGALLSIKQTDQDDA